MGPPYFNLDRIDSSFYKKEDIENLRRLFNSELPLKTLLDISNKITDGPHDGYTFVDNGVLFLRSQNIKNAGFDLSDKKFIEPEFHNKYRKSWLEQGDLLITRIGQYFGNAAVVSKDYVGCNINHAIAKVQLKKEVDPYYVCAYINSPTGNKLYRRLGKSFTSPRVNLADFSEFLVPLPARKIQTYIGNKIRKAEELREEAKRLKEEAEEILFNELRIKELEHLLMEQNKKYNWVEETALTERIDAYYYKAKYTILDKFISQFEYVITKKIADVEYGYMPQEDYTEVDSGIPIIRITNMPGNLLIDSSDIKHIPVNEKIKDRHFVRENDILMVQLGDTTGKVAYVSKEFDGYFIPVILLKNFIKRYK